MATSWPRNDVVWDISCKSDWTLLLWKYVWTDFDSYSRMLQRHAGNISYTMLTDVTRAWTYVFSARWCYHWHSENFPGCASSVASTMADFLQLWCALPASLLTGPHCSWLFSLRIPKSKVFDSWPANLIELETIQDEISNIAEDMLQEVMRSFSICVHRCIHYNDAHLKDLLFSKWNTE
jgi:hypothetical protein